MRAAFDSMTVVASPRQLLAMLLWAILIPCPVHALEPEIKVIALKHRLPDEVLPALRPLLGPGESISGHDTKLIVRATPRTLVQLERLLAEIDTARRNLRISVRLGSARSTTGQSLGLSGEQQLGTTRIVVTDPRRGSDVTVGRSDGSGVALHGEHRVTTTHGASEPFLLVQDGGRGVLQIGESIPSVQPYLALAGRRLVVAADIQYYDVTTGFEVEPRVLGDRVLLRISPRLAFRSNRGTQTVEFRELRTEITVKPGEWVDLGGAVGSANDVNRQIFSRRQQTAADDDRFLVRVDPL